MTFFIFFLFQVKFTYVEIYVKFKIFLRERMSFFMSSVKASLSRVINDSSVLIFLILNTFLHDIKC